MWRTALTITAIAAALILGAVLAGAATPPDDEQGHTVCSERSER